MAKTRKGKTNRGTGEGDKGLDIYSRCSPSYFYNGMDEVRQRMNIEQRLAIRKTPFGAYIDIPRIGGSFARVQSILRRFQVRTASFVVGEEILIPFTGEEFSVVMGLQHVGQPIDMDLKMPSDTVRRLFDNKMHNVSRPDIYSKMLDLVDRHSEIDVKDLCRLYILFVFNCILFPMSNYSTPKFLLPYVDDLDGIETYAWGDATYKFLLNELKTHVGGDSGKRYFDGCTIGLMAWIHEHVPSLGSPRSLRAFPRFFRWDESKIPTTSAAAEEMLNGVSQDRVLPIHPLPEERKFLMALQGPVEEVPIDVATLEVLLADKDKEIEKLKKELSEMEKKAVIGAGKKRKKEDEAGGEGTVEVDVVDEGLVEVEVDVVDEGLAEKEGVEKEGLEKDEEKDEMDKEHGSMGSPQLVAATEEACGSSPRSEDGALLNYVISSIVETVQQREDRKKKEKDEDFMTPPSTTTPKPKKQKTWRRKGRPRQKMEESAAVVGTSEADVHVPRTDFKGHEHVNDEERRLIEKLLAIDYANITVWRSGDFLVHGDVMSNLLFGEELRSDLVDCYIRILSSPSYRTKYGHGVWCIDTIVMFDIFNRLEMRKKKQALKMDEYQGFLETMMGSARILLGSLTLEVLNSNHFIIMPLNTKAHWYLLVFDTVEKKFTHMNSLWSPQNKGSAKKFAKFLSGYLLYSLGYEIKKPDVYCRKSTQQGGVVDCGVYMCLWAEAFAQNTSEFWAYADNCSIDGHRARMAANILSHESGLFCGEKT